MNPTKSWRAMLLLGGMCVITGCSSLGVEPWDRDVLAKDEMQLVSAPLDARKHPAAAVVLAAAAVAVIRSSE